MSNNWVGSDHTARPLRGGDRWLVKVPLFLLFKKVAFARKKPSMII